MDNIWKSSIDNMEDLLYIKKSGTDYCFTKESNILFTFLQVMGLFFRSESPGSHFRKVP
jgi:hypothetical protein